MAEVTNYGQVNQRTAAWAAVEMLDHAEPVLVLAKFGTAKPLPKNKANTVKFRRPIPFSAATTPLLEGVTPTAQKMSFEDVTCVLKQWGKPIEITDVVQDLAEDPVLKEASMLAGEQAGLTVEMVTWGIVAAGTNVSYTNGAVRTAVNTPITLAKQRKVTRALMAQKGKKMRQILSPSPNYGTKAIEAAYIGVGHSDLDSDIRNLAGFTPTAEYGSRQVLCPEEVGAAEQVRYVLSPELASLPDAGAAKGGSGTEMVSTSGTSADVYRIIFIAQGFYGLVPLKGAGSITPMVLNPGTPSKSDPMGQRGYVSWKAYFNAVILNESWGHRLEAAVTNL